MGYAEGSLGELPSRRVMTNQRFAFVPRAIESRKLAYAEATGQLLLAQLRRYLSNDR
jgi:hypothetical protein